MSATLIKAPRDVIERATQLWVPGLMTDFPVGSTVVGDEIFTPTGDWFISVYAAGVSIGSSGGLNMTAPAANPQVALAANPSVAQPTGAWRAICSVQWADLASGASLALEIIESETVTYSVQLADGLAQFYAYTGSTPSRMDQADLRSTPSWELMLESDGEWVWAFVNGQLIGCVRRLQVSTDVFQLGITLSGTSSSSSSTSVASVMFEALQPFLMRGSDVGDRVTPGAAVKRPDGGLRARFT